MPVFEAARYVAAAVESLRAQTFSDFELLIYDDGSTDGSAELIETTAAGDPRVKLFRRPHRGHTVWLQEGVATARGEFLARMDADDLALPQRLARQVEYLRRHPDCGVVGTDALLIDPDGRPIRPLAVRTEHEAIEAELLAGRGDAILHPSALFRRAALVELGGYRPEFEPAEDLELYLRLAERWRVANLPETLLLYRQHLASVCTERKGAMRRVQRAILAEANRRRGLAPPSERCQAAEPPERTPAVDSWHRWAHGAIEGGHLATARRYAWFVFRSEPFSSRASKLLVRALLGLRRNGWWAKSLRRLGDREARRPA